MLTGHTYPHNKTNVLHWLYEKFKKLIARELLAFYRLVEHPK